MNKIVSVWVDDGATNTLVYEGPERRVRAPADREPVAWLNDKDCMDCGVCPSCVERSRAYVDPSAPLLEALRQIGFGSRTAEVRLPSGIAYECDQCGAQAYGSIPIEHEDDCPVRLAREAIERHEGGEHG